MSCGRDEERGLPPQLCEEAYAVRKRGPLCLIVDSCCDLQRKQPRAVNVILHVCLNLTFLRGGRFNVVCLNFERANA